MRSPQSLPQRIHIVGAGGAGMSGLAKLLSQLGHTVTGSDLKPGRMLDALSDVGVETWIGHQPERAAGASLVVCSSAVPDHDPEVTAARNAGVDVWQRPALLAALTEANPAFGCAGTHGKTTSSALAVTALRGSGDDPSFLVGGEMLGLNTGAHAGGGRPFVLEADEAFGTFRHLDLSTMLVTNIEADHLDHYGTVAALEDAFAQVASAVGGPVVACIDDPGVRRLMQRVDVVSYGRHPSARWNVADLRHEAGGVRFTLAGPDNDTQVMLPKPGNHLASNAAGVLALLAENGFDVATAAEALAAFGGVRRRYEIRSLNAGITIVDDYAHHPTEVAATIEAATLGTEGKVIAVFQPHRYTRTADLGVDFGGPLAAADEVIVTDVYAAGEHPMIGVSGRIVAVAAEAAGASVSYVPHIRDAVPMVDDLAVEGDTVLLLGAGDIGTIAPDLSVAFEARP